MSKSNKIFEGIDFSGFDALDELDAATSKRTTGTSIDLPLSSIIEDPEQPRKVFDKAALNELAESIRERDVLQAITVRPPDTNGKHVIVMGARRYRASLLAGKETIPAVIRVKASDSYDQMIENIQRETLSHRDVAAFIRDQVVAGVKKSAIAKSLGKPPAWVSLYVDFFDMDPAIQSGAEDYGTRAAHELHAAMQIDADATRAFLSGDQPITTRSAAAFRQSLKTGRNGAMPQAQPNDPEPSAPGASIGSRVGGEQSGAPSQGRPSAAPKAEAPKPAVSSATRELADPRPVEHPSSTASESVTVRELAVNDAGSGPAHEPVAPVAKDDLQVSPAMLVRLGDREGRLLLEREAGQGGSFGVVTFQDGAEEARLSDLVLLEIVRAEGGRTEDA